MTVAVALLDAEQVLPVVLRWAHVLAVGVWTGAAFAVASGAPGTPGTPGTTGAEGERRGPGPAALVRGAAGAAWLAGLALLFLNYYAADAPPYFFAPLDARAAGTPVAGEWLSALAAVVGAAGLQQFVGRRVPQAVALAVAGAVGVALLLGLEALGLSARAAWVHLGAYLGTCMALAALVGRPTPAQARRRARGQLALAVPAVLAMLAVHLPELLGAGRPWLAAGAVLAVGLAAGGWMVRALLPEPAGAT